MTTAGPAGSRRPIEDWERPLLLQLGRLVRRHRQAAGMTQAEVACIVGLAERSLRRIEAGDRRTRRTTLERVVAACGASVSDLEALVLAAGAALAPESAYADRVDARRARRQRRAARRPVTEHTATYEWFGHFAVVTHQHRRWTGRRSSRLSSYTRVQATADAPSR